MSLQNTLMETKGPSDGDKALWLVINGDKVDLTDFAPRHPGGHLALQHMKGKDASMIFRAYHPDETYKMVKKFRVESAPRSEEVPHLKAFKEMDEEMRRKGLYTPDTQWNLKMMAWLALLFTTAMYFSLRGSNSTWSSVILGAIFLGAFWQQTAFFAHDGCHSSVFKAGRQSQIATAIISSLLGIGGPWWKHTHNVHHVVTNDPESDPDVQHLPVFAVSEFFLQGFYSKHHGRNFYFDKVAQALVSNQHLLYYPIMAVARVNLYVQSILFLVAGQGFAATRGIDLACMLSFLAWNTLLLKSLPTYSHIGVFFIISHAIAGLIHVQITISHFAMPIEVQPDDSYDFVRTQLDHTMDVDCEPWMDWFHGGLQFQVVHHLFPRLPRSRLRFVRDNYVVPYCKKYGLNYLAYDFITCNKMVIENFRQVAMKARERIMKEQDAA